MCRAPTRSSRDRADDHYRAVLLEDRAILALAALAEVGPDNAVSDQLIAAAPSVQHLSLRNQLRLLVQAGEKKLVLRDVDTYDGWCRRGRVPNQPGLRIVRPHDDPGHDSADPAARARRRAKFRAAHRWEFAQTVPRDDATDPQPQRGEAHRHAVVAIGVDLE